MKKTSIICMVIAIIMASCNDPKPNGIDSNSHSWKFDKLSAEKTIYIDNDSTKPGMKVNIEFNYPSGYKNDTILHDVQSQFVLALAGTDFMNLKPKEAFDKFEKAQLADATKYGEYAAGDGPDFADYFMNTTVGITDSTDLSNYITAKTASEYYTGGAHGMHTDFYYNIDTRNGKLIKEDIFLKSDGKKTLTKLLNELLPNQTNAMGDTISILDPEKTIEPNGNFYFKNTGIVYVFNPYDITPYSDGVVEVEIPFEKLKNVINPNYDFLINRE